MAAQPLINVVLSDKFKRRFFDRIDIREDHVCWPWTGFIDRDGYGRPNNISQASSRVMLMVLLEDPLEDLFVLHTCDNPVCCNPFHLFLGTQLDNVRDCHSKGRGAVTAGERNGRALLTADQVIEARRLYATGIYTQTELGEHFGVNQRTISAAVTGTTWK